VTEHWRWKKLVGPYTGLTIEAGAATSDGINVTVRYDANLRDRHSFGCFFVRGECRFRVDQIRRLRPASGTASTAEPWIQFNGAVTGQGNAR